MTAELRFDGQVAVVTGAGGGLGAAYAGLLAARGAAVVVNDIDAGRAGEVAAAVAAAGGAAVADGHDVATAEGGAAVVAAALAAYGRVDAVVNNAGILADRAFHHLSPADFDAVVAVHLGGAVHVTRAAWPHLRAQGYGRVVMATSSSGLLGNAGQANYGAAKAALVGLARSLAAEGARHGIAVNAVAPLARTAMTEALLGPAGARLPPELVAPVVAWLCHRDCPVSGEVLSAGGGRVARYFVGLTPGICDPALTLESLAARWPEVADEAGYAVPATPAAEVAALLARLEGVSSK